MGMIGRVLDRILSRFGTPSDPLLVLVRNSRGDEWRIDDQERYLTYKAQGEIQLYRPSLGRWQYRASHRPVSWSANRAVNRLIGRIRDHNEAPLRQAVDRTLRGR